MSTMSASHPTSYTQSLGKSRINFVTAFIPANNPHNEQVFLIPPTFMAICLLLFLFLTLSPTPSWSLKPVFCAPWSSQAAISRIPYILDLMSDCSLHIPSLTYSGWSLWCHLSSPQASHELAIFSHIPWTIQFTSEVNVLIASFSHIQPIVPPFLLCKILSLESHKIKLYHPIPLILGISGLLAPCHSPSLLWPSF